MAEDSPFPANSIHVTDSLQKSFEERQNDSNVLTVSGNMQEGVDGQRSTTAPLSPKIPDYNDGKMVGSVNDPKIYTYRGKKIAGFEIQGTEMICLPQAYEIILKNVIGGLHTVYTKLKRLQIRPIVCSVEQVRALRSLGAIHQGVNRCKLISCDDFDRLYDDCYKIYPRPGRPAKRSIDDGKENPPRGKSMKHDFIADPLTSFTEMEPNVVSRGQVQVYGTLMPFAAQQLIVQHMMNAAAAAASQQIHLFGKTMDGTRSEQLSRESSLSYSLSNNSKSNSPPLAPLNLAKNSETGSDVSYEQYSSSRYENNIESDHSIQNTPTEDEQALQYVMSKLISFIEVATTNFKKEREMIENEKSFAHRLQSELELKRSDYEKMQRQLFKEQKKAKIYFRLYCKAKREFLELKEKVIDANNNNVDSQLHQC